MAEWLWEEHHRVLFFYTAELGGFSARVEQRIRQGLIRPFRMRTRDDINNSLSFETMHLSSKGYVPVRFINHQTGVVEPGVPMVAPVSTVYAQVCPNCGDVWRKRSKPLSSRQCERCKKQVTLAQTPPSQEIVQTPGFEQIGTMAYDGLTSFSDWYLQDMSHRKNLEGEKAALGGDIISGDMVFRGNNRSQVGQAQTRVHELVANSLGIPNLVTMPVWTAIAHESSDDTGRLQIVGPKLAGDAKTYIAASWFGNMLEAEVVTNEKGEYIRRLYLSQFYDEHNRRHLCGHRGDPRFMPIYIEDAPYSDQHPPTTQTMCQGFSLKTFMRLLEESIQKGMAADDDLKDAPGISAIPATYGDVADQTAAAPASPVPAGTARPAVRRPAPRGQAPKPAAVVQETPVTPAEESPASAEASTAVEETPTSPPAEESAGDGEPAGAGPETATDATTPAQPEVPAPSPAAHQTPPPAQAEVAPRPTSQQPPGWTRPAGARPSAPPAPPAPRAPQAGPRPPVRAVARPVTTVKPS